MRKFKFQAFRLFSAALALMFIALAIQAQDAFEVQVYEYETVPKGMWNLETHMNFTGRGTKFFEGPVAPTNHQFHLTFELTRGITDNFEMAGYLVLAARPDGGAEYAGWRLRPRVSLPKSWHLPVDVSLSGEVGFPHKVYEENSVTFEFRPILEKKLGRWQLDFNPVLARALRGPGKHDGWEFEPGARVGYGINDKLDLSLEYYGATGPLREPLPRGEQVHQFYPGWDYQFSKNLVWNFGIGVGVTEAGNRLVYKSRIGYLFGKKK
ncbi:MAG: transporter [Acidobacteria bacterium]|nr:transporter [Acidobacteriota bacterium]MBI3427757.1 transporter [Acidobacteriota bacterium]